MAVHAAASRSANSWLICARGWRSAAVQLTGPQSPSGRSAQQDGTDDLLRCGSGRGDDTRPLGAATELGACRDHDRRVGVDLPHLDAPVTERVVDPSVVDVGKLEDRPQLLLVRVRRDEVALLLQQFLVFEVHLLHVPVAAEEEMSSQDRVADLERRVLAIHAVGVRGVAELDDEEVARIGSFGAQFADRGVHVVRVVEEPAPASTMVVLTAQEDGKPAAVERHVLPVHGELVDAGAVQCADEVDATQGPVGVVEHSTAASEKAVPQVGGTPELLGAHELEIGEAVGGFDRLVLLEQRFVVHGRDHVADRRAVALEVPRDRVVVAGGGGDDDHERYGLTRERSSR